VLCGGGGGFRSAPIAERRDSLGREEGRGLLVGEVVFPIIERHIFGVVVGEPEVCTREEAAEEGTHPIDPYVIEGVGAVTDSIQDSWPSAHSRVEDTP